MSLEINLGYFSIATVAEEGLSENVLKEYKDMDESGKELDMDEIVIKEEKVKLKIDYPTTNPYVTLLENVGGFTRKLLIELICKHYKKMYDEENESTIINAGHIPGMFNRNHTDGKYGIWGHDIEDLMLHTACVDKLKKGGLLVTVGCDS